MDKDRGERIKTNSAEFLWICCGIRPPPLPDKPVRTDRGATPEHLQVHLRRPNSAAPTTRK
jgi:hypothetical protein